MAERGSTESFSEKGFYLAEFRGRTLGIVARASDLARPAPLERLLDELAANGTRVVLMTTAAPTAGRLAGGAPIDASAPRLEGAVWRALARSPHVGVVIDGGEGFFRAWREVALRLGLGKVLLVDAQGGLRRQDGSPGSFVDLEELRRWLRECGDGADPRRVSLLHEVERALGAGVRAVNLCTLEGLADELFTYAGSGTLFTRERYVVVRRLGIDDYDLADDLVARGVAEGYLAPRTPEQVEQVLVAGFGAFVEGSHLAGIGALLEHADERAGEIASLYTLTRFLGEGVGAHLVGFAFERARQRGLAYVFACTTSEPVVGFFERQGFRRVDPSRIPAAKWRDYDSARRARVSCLRADLD
jgi:N-acetylglutamate synthase-like GNAT family acetyltransferase